MIDSIKGVDFLFPTLVYRSLDKNFSSVKDQMINDAYEVKKYDRGGAIKSNEGGWQSNTDLTTGVFANHTKYITERVYDTLPEYLHKQYTIASVWLCINKPGDFNWTHFHTESLLSGVMWLKIGAASGKIRFENNHEYYEYPNISRTPIEIQENTKNLTSYEIVPNEGEMMIFPSWLRHAVTPNKSIGNRISVAFNLV